MALAPNTVVQCGLDGHRNNACILEGGFVQVLMQTQVPGIDVGISDHLFLERNLTVDNVTIRGFTFTGISESVAIFGGLSFLLSQSGNVTVEDCRWTDMTAPTNVVYVGRNDYQQSEAGGYTDVPKLSSQLVLRNCQFDNIVYDNSLISTWDQIVHVQNCTFVNLSTSLLTSDDCYRQGKCSRLLRCLADAKCSLSESCIENMETRGPGLILAQKAGNLVTAPPGVLQNDDNGSMSNVSSSSLESVLASYNNYYLNNNDGLLEQVSCEVAIANAGIDGDSGLTPRCYQDLAFEASECSRLIW